MERRIEKFEKVGQNWASSKHSISKPMRDVTDQLVELWYSEVILKKIIPNYDN